MRSVINAVGISLLLAVFASAFAQSPVVDDAASDANVDEPLAPCVPNSVNDTAGDDSADGQTDGVVCEEQIAETAAPEESYPGEAAEDNFADADLFEPETTGDDVTAEEEIESGEEISEDYPVPLPADI